MAWRRPARWLVLAAVATGASAPAASAQNATSFQQDHAHTGRLDASSPAPPLVQRWSHDLGANTSYPLIVDGRVFVAALHGSVYGPVLYAFDLATGAELWSRRLGGEAPRVRVILLVGGRVLSRGRGGRRSGHHRRQGQPPCRTPPCHRAGLGAPESGGFKH